MSIRFITNNIVLLYVGYVKQAGKLTQIMVRNAGHFVAIDQPKWVLDMLTKLTSGKGFRFD